MRKFLFILIAACISLTVSAQIDRSKAPASGPAPKVNIGEYKSFTLPNGLKVLVVENNRIPKITFSLVVKLDPILEKDKAGYLDITGELWGKATTGKNAKQLSEDIDFIGASLSTNSSHVSISGLSKFKPQMMETFSDVILHPAFPQDEFDKLVLQTKTALKTEETNPGSILRNITNTTMFGANHPYGDISTPATIDNITVADCQNYYKNSIFPNNSTLVIVGDITLKEAQKLTEQYFGSWKAGQAPAYQYDKPQQVQGRKVVFSNKDAAPQASISVTYPISFKVGDADELAVKVMNQILGGGSFQAKLFKNLRETKGYTYGAYSNISANNTLDGAGEFSASSEVKASIVDSAFMEILKEMQNMVDADFTAESVEMTKKMMAGSFSRSLESPTTIADFAYSIDRYKLPKDYYTTYLERLSKVTKEDVIAAAKKFIHPDNAYLFAVTDRGVKNLLTTLSSDDKITELDNVGKPVSESPKVSADVTTEQIINKYLKAIGGTELLKTIKDMTITSEMNIQGMTITNTYKYQIVPGKPAFMMEVAMGGNVMQKIIFDGEKATISGPNGNQILEGEEAASMKEEAYPILEAEYANLGIAPTIEGIEKVNGRDAYKLKVAKGQAVTYSFYDVENGLKVKSVGTQEGMTQEVSFEDYRPTSSGVIYPFLSKTSMQGMPIEIKVTDVKTNTGLKAEDFK